MIVIKGQNSLKKSKEKVEQPDRMTFRNSPQPKSLFQQTSRFSNRGNMGATRRSSKRPPIVPPLVNLPNMGTPKHHGLVQSKTVASKLS